MPKLNNRHDSLFQFLVKRNFLFFPALDRALYPKSENSKIKDRVSDVVPGHLGNIVSGFHPFQAIAKDFIDTFKPYKGSYQIKRDALQPVSGFGNILKGIGTLIATPVIFLINIFRYVGYIFNPQQSFIEAMKLNLSRSAGWLIEGVSSIIRGALQIITAPLVWFPKMPIRLILTAFMGFTPAEGSAGIKKLLKENEDLSKDKKIIFKEKSDKLIYIGMLIHLKYQQGLENGQNTKLDSDKETKLFQEIQWSYIPTIRTYLNFFSPASQEEKSNHSNTITSTQTQGM